MSAKLRYKEAQEKVKEARREMERVAKVAFNQGAQELFATQPTLTSFGWRQYTPYFNDGEECVFGANVEEPMVNGVHVYGDEEEGKYNDKLATEVTEFLRGFDEEDLKALFGDHVEVVVERGKDVEVSGYEHD